MNRKILITGGAGYVGSHLVRHLMEMGVAGSRLLIVDNLSTSSLRFIPSEVAFERIDLRSKVGVERLFKKYSIDLVIHLAGSAYVSESIKDPGKYFENNVVSSINLFDAMSKNDCKTIVFSSTCSVYGNALPMGVIEDQEIRILNPYANSKFIVERLLQSYVETQGFSSVTLRYFNVAGAGYSIGEDHFPETRIIPTAISAAIDGTPLNIYGSNHNTIDGTCVRDYVHVIDIAHAHFLAMQYLKKNKHIFEIFNIGSGLGVSVQELLHRIETCIDKKIIIKFCDARIGDPPALVCNSQKAQSILGWTPQFDIDQIINSTYKWKTSGLRTFYRDGI